MKNNSTENYAIITGGSAGIGLAFAEELANDGYNLVLVSNNREDLDSAEQDLGSKFNVTVETLFADLSNADDLEKVQERISDNEKPVEILINSAGFVLRDSLVHGDLDRQRLALKVMVESVLVLSQTAAKIMRDRGSGTIINIASSSAWFFNGGYSALKRWVVTYTQALAVELMDTNVNVIAICPGQTLTDFHANGGIKRPENTDWTWSTPQQVARQGLRAARKGKIVFIPNFRWRMAMWFIRHFQFIAKRTSRKLIVKRIAEVDAKNRHG